MRVTAVERAFVLAMVVGAIAGAVTVHAQEAVTTTRSIPTSSSALGDTCTGALCLIGPQGINNDGGEATYGYVTKSRLNSTGGVFANNQYNLAFPYDGPSSTHGICLQTNYESDAGMNCAARLTYTNTSTQSVIRLGPDVSNDELIDGGRTTLKEIAYGIAGQHTFSGFIYVDAGILQRGAMSTPVTDSAGTAQQISSGSGAMTAGALAVTFTTAFGAAPKCTCSHVNAVPIGCGISAAPSTTGVTFAVPAAGTDVLHWICVGDRA